MQKLLIFSTKISMYLVIKSQNTEQVNIQTSSLSFKFVFCLPEALIC